MKLILHLSNAKLSITEFLAAVLILLEISGFCKTKCILLTMSCESPGLNRNPLTPFSIASGLPQLLGTMVVRPAHIYSNIDNENASPREACIPISHEGNIRVTSFRLPANINLLSIPKSKAIFLKVGKSGPLPMCKK